MKRGEIYNMYLTQTNVVRHLTKQQYSVLYLMCQLSNNLYNFALYNIRQHYLSNKRLLSYEDNYKICKNNENYKLLQAGIAQQILKYADRSFKSFLGLVKKAKNGDYSFSKIRMPYYHKRGSLFGLILSTNAISVRNGFLRIPISRRFKKIYGKTDIYISFPDRLAEKTVKEVRILPLYEGRAFKIQFVYEDFSKTDILDSNRWLSIDLGIENLAACIDCTGTSFIMDGRGLKSINRYFNKQKAYYQGIANRQDLKYTKRLCRLSLKRDNRVKDIMHKSAGYITKYCVSKNIGVLVIGYNKDIKQRCDMGKRNNQKFASIPYSYFRQFLAYLCERHGIRYIEQEESYSSKASFKDLDNIPVCDKNTSGSYKFSGHRVKRGLYEFSDGIFVNADINGALNIMRKSKQNFSYEELCRGLLDSPMRIRVS